MLEITSKSEIIEYLEKIKNRIVSEVSPEQIYLFGSYAKNNYNNESDIDLLIVMNNNDKSLRKIQHKISSLLDDRTMPIDIIVYSQEKMKNRKDIIGTLPYRINQEGELIYEKERKDKSKQRMVEKS